MWPDIQVCNNKQRKANVGRSRLYNILHHKYLKPVRLSIRFLSVLGGYNPKPDEDI